MSHSLEERRGPGDRGSRPDRLAHCRSTRSTRESARFACWTTWCGAAGEPRPGRWPAADHLPRRGRPRPRHGRDCHAGCDYVFHQAAIRITLCAESRGSASTCSWVARSTSSRRRWRRGVRKVVYASSASVYGGAEMFPTSERHHPYNNRTLYGAAKLMNEGSPAASATCTAWPASGCATSTSTGPGWTITGAYTEVFIRWLDCIDRGAAPADSRRRHGIHGFRLRRRHRPGQHPGDEVGP